MASCPKLEKCPFFNDRLPGKPATAEMYKIQYCRGTFATCARFLVSEAGIPVPEDLFPTQKNRVEEILKNTPKKDPKS